MVAMYSHLCGKFDFGSLSGSWNHLTIPVVFHCQHNGGVHGGYLCEPPIFHVTKHGSHAADAAEPCPREIRRGANAENHHNGKVTTK